MSDTCSCKECREERARDRAEMAESMTLAEWRAANPGKELP